MRKWHIITWSLGLILLGCLGVAQAGTVTYVYTDAQGTPVMESDAQGHITAQFDYTPYGTQALGTAPNGPGYTGHVNDPDTGLVYMQARHYGPETHMLSPDPVGPTPGNIFGFNRYTYANNNPITNTDPNGMFPGDAGECSHMAYPCFVSGSDENGGGAGQVGNTSSECWQSEFNRERVCVGGWHQ